MRGELNEFTLAELLQLFAFAEKTGVVEVTSNEHNSRLFLAAGRVSGWGLTTFNLPDAVLRCEFLPQSAVTSLDALRASTGEPGLDFIIRNLLEPHRWDWFTRRLLEQDIYPVLTLEHGAFEVSAALSDPPPVGLSLSVQELILDGSRWEADMQELADDGFSIAGTWRRAARDPNLPGVELNSATWLIWAALGRPERIGAIADRVAMPDLDAVRAIKALHQSGLVERA